MDQPAQRTKQPKVFGLLAAFMLITAVFAGAALSVPRPVQAAGRPTTPAPTPTSGGISEPTSGNLVTNSDFSDGLHRWSYYMDNTAMAYRSVTNGEYVYQITDPGNYAYSIQFQRWALPIVNGRAYAVFFSARALEGTRTIIANVGGRENPWPDYSGAKTITLTSTMQRFSYTFTMTQPTDLDSQISFQLGLNASDVVFDSIALYDLTGGTIPSAPPMPTPSQTYSTLVWSDEFNGTSVDSANWTFETGRGMNGWGNAELEYYTSRPQNASVANGMLTITALKERYNGAQYTSARLKTQGKHSFTYGKIEARVMLPKGQGIWPAFWTLGESIATQSWPDCGEIDIMEMIGGGEMRDDTMFGNLHWSQADGSHMNTGESYTIDPGDLGNSWHTVAIVWDTQYIYYFFDGIQYHYIEISDPAKSEFHAPHFILLNLAVGGVWPGYPDANTVFPQQYKIDYVRVYQ